MRMANRMASTMAVGVLAGVMSCLLLGCGENGGERDTQGPIAVLTAPERTVLVRVNDVDITAGDFRRRLDFECGTYGFGVRHAKNPPKDPERRIGAFASHRYERILPQLIHVALLNGYLADSCGGPKVEGAEAFVAKKLKRLGGKPGEKLSQEEFAREIGVPLAYLKDQLLIELRDRKAREHFDPACTNVSEQEIDEGLARLDAYTARAIATNRVTWAICSNALARAKSGEDFKAVGKAFGIDDEEVAEWGDFMREELEDEKLKAWAFAAKVGEIGGPFDLEDGLSIVKVIARTDGAESASLAAQEVASVKLARINFLMVEENPEPRTREHCRKALLDWKAQDAQTRLFTNLFNKARIAYPNGTEMNFKGGK